MAFNVPKEEQPEFNKKVQSGLNLFAKDVQRTLGQLEVLQPQTLVEAYNQPVQAPVTRDLTPLEQYVYEPQPAPEVKSLTETPAKESMVVPQESPQVLSNFVNQAQAQFSRDMVSITPYEQAVTDVVGAEVDSLRNDAGEIAKSPLEVFSKPLDANKVRALGLVDQDGNPTERGQLFYNLQQSGVFNEDGTINEKGQAYLTSIEDMKNPEWFQQPGSKEKFDILWEDGVIRSSSTPGEILSNLTKFAGDAVYGGAELAQQQAMGLAYNSRTWGGLLGMEDSRPDYLKARGEATELSIAENMYKNVIQTSNLIDVGLAADKQFIDDSILSPVYGALEKITGIQRPQPPEIEQTNANIKNSKDELVAARYQQWAADQRLADMEAGEIGETVFGIDNAVQKAEAAKQELGDEEFNKVYGRVGAFTNIAGDPTNAIPAAFAVKASKAVPLASRAMLGAQKTMGKIAAIDIAIAQGNTAVQASRAALAKVEPTVNLAQRMAANFAEGAKTQPALLERSAKASQIASRVTAEANQIRSTLPTITAELDSLIAKRNSLATRIPEEYSKKVLQTMELGRQMRAMPAKAVGATLERVGDTISKTDTAVTNFLQERGLDQMYTAAVGAAGVVGLAGNPIIGAIGAGAAALKTGNVLSNYGKLFRYVGKEMENVRGQIPFWKRVAAHTAPGSLGRGFAHTFNMLDLGGVTSDTIRRAGRGIAAAAPTDLMFEYLSDGADMRPETLWQAGAESFVIGGSFAAGGGAFMGTKKRMRELSIGDELNFRRNLTDTRQKALFEAIPAGTRRAISTYAIANPTLNYTFKDSGASRYDPNTNTAVINVNSTNPIKALVAHETLHHTVIKNNMEPGIAALFLGDTKNNTVGGLFRSRDGKLDPNFEAFRDGYYKRLGVEGMSNAERDAIYPLDKIAVEYFIEKHADQYAAMAESGELGAVASSGAARRKLGSILETVLPRIPVLKDLHFKSGGMIDKNGAWVTGNGILDAEGVKRDPITSKMFRDMNRRSAGLVPGQFDPLMSDKPDSGAPILLNPSDSIDAELLHPLVQVDDANKPIMKDGKPVALDRATELSRALAGLTAVEVMRRKRAENYAPEKGEAHVDDEGQFQPGWLSNDVLTEMFAKNKYNPEQKRIIREMNKLIRKGAGDRVVMINFPATTRNKAGKVVYKPQGATLRDTVPVAVTISKDGNLLFGLMSVTKLHENIQKRSQDRRGKKLYGGNVDLILRDTQAMMDYHKQGLDSIEFFKQKYGAVEADERKKFINTMFGLLNKKEQAVLNPMLLEDGIKSKDNVYRTYRADRVSKAVPMAPEEYAAMPFSYEAVSQVRMPEAQRAMPEGEQGGDVTLTRLREIRNGLDENLTEREAIDELDFIINDAPSGYFPQDILNKVDQAKRDLEEEFTTWAGRGDSEASTESAISSVMSFLDSKESRGEAAPTRFMPEGVDEDKFYSQLERVITDKVPTRATAQQIMATIDPTRGSGVKADEIKWSGIEQALASLEKDGKVSKEDLLNYLRNEGRVRFEEVVSSEFNQDAFPQGWSFRLDTESADGSGLVIDPQGRMFADADNESHARQLARDAAGAAPKFSQYVLPGGENYREVVLAMANKIAEEEANLKKQIFELKKRQSQFEQQSPEWNEIQKQLRDLIDRQSDLVRMPSSERAGYTSSHFPDIPNYVAHMRTNERTLDDGSEGLFVEEFQSDRHQEGRKKGYASDRQSREKDISTRNEIWRAYDAGEIALSERNQRLESLGAGGGVADAPFRTTWPIQLFKRALRDAVDGGKDWIGWTTGETQAERFDLSKQVDSISVPMVNADGSRSVRIDPKDGTSFKMMVDSNGIVNGYQSADQFTGKRLDEVVGKDMADKIIALESPANFEGNDLKVGGSGMRGFYDNMLPKEVGKYVKQWGGKVEKAEIDIREPASEAWYKEPTDDDYKPIWKVNITPEMRKISQTGQMRFMPEQLDSDYMKAVESGDVESQQRMVDEAAKMAGWNVIPVSHGSGAQFNEFKREFLGTSTGGKSANEAFFFTNSPKTSRNYATYAAEEGPIKELLRKADEAEKKGDWDAYEKFLTEAEDASYGELGAEAAAKRRENAKVYNVYLKGKFMELDAEGKTPEELSATKDLSEFDGSLTAAIKKAKKDGYDGVVFRNLDDAPNISDPSDHYAVIDPKAIKLSDPITRDDSGNVIPLSKRFDVGSRDMRFMPEGEPMPQRLDISETLSGRAVKTKLKHSKDNRRVDAENATVFSPSLRYLPEPVYHGTPHDVEKFSTEKIGTGEGAQAYGWGLYFAGNQSVAEGYQRDLSGFDELVIYTKDGKKKGNQLDDIDLEAAKYLESGLKAAGQFKHNAVYYAKEQAKSAGLENVVERLDKYGRDAKVSYEKNTGNLYTVKLKPNDNEFLDWDEPIMKQSKSIQKIAKNLIKSKLPDSPDYGVLKAALDLGGYSLNEIALVIDNDRKLYDSANTITSNRSDDQSPGEALVNKWKGWVELNTIDGKRLYEKLSENGIDISDRTGVSEKQKSISKQLLKLGVKGIRYLDAMSRKEGQGSYNYVVFDENDIEITHKNSREISNASAIANSAKLK